MPEQIDWDAYFMQMAEVASTKSKDDNTRYGAAIVDSDKNLVTTGYNGMPRGVNEHPHYRRKSPHKYNFFEHAERNAIYAAARRGVQILNCTMYVLELPCAPCARGIVQAGITEIVTANSSIPKPGSYQAGDWRATVGDGVDILHEGGVRIRLVGSLQELNL